MFFPILKLVFCTKVVKKNQSRASCSLCLKIFYLRCFGMDDGETCCNSCYFSNNNDRDGSEQMQQVDSVKVIPVGLSDHELICCAHKLNYIKYHLRIITLFCKLQP